MLGLEINDEEATQDEKLRLNLKYVNFNHYNNISYIKIIKNLLI